MARVGARAAPSRVLKTEPGADASSPANASGADRDVALALLLAALAEQQRTNQALYRLVRRLSGVRAHRTVDRSRQPGQEFGAPRPAEAPSSPTTQAVPQAPPQQADLPAAGQPQLLVRCFGRFEVVRDGHPIQRWRRSKARTLFKYLVARRQPVPRDVLIDMLWPEADPHTAVNGLRVALHALRRDLGPCGADGQPDDYVIFDGGSYLLNPRARISVDADEFAAHFAAGRRLERQQRTGEAMRHYERAEAVYRDDYLLEDQYEEWTLVRREELKDQYLMVLTKLADHCIQQGDVEGCIVRCHRILQKDICREDAYQRLIRSYLQLGQRSQALHWYDLCVRTLRQELDVAPSERTRRLVEHVAPGKCG